MFVDSVKLQLKAGDGGNGAVNFRHEKFIENGGPDGGDGGNGGDIVMVASTNQDTLANFRYKKQLSATPGQAGSKRKRHGKNGEDLILEVPVGTMVYNEENELLADLTQDKQQTVIVRGGKGGYGNAHFTSSVRQAPRVAEKGEKGEKLEVSFELKMIADVGLVGLPNAGKSTLLASTSNAKPEIADYPFTTLIPNLGMVNVDDTSLLVADIPGLIEGASSGKGLGDEFLKHIERTAVIIHLIDAYQDDVAAAYKVIQKELKNYSINLTKKPQLVALNKTDGLERDIIDDKLRELREVVPKTSKLFAISAKSKDGVVELMREAVKASKKQRTAKAKKAIPGLPVLRMKQSDRAWSIVQDKKYFVVTGTRIEKFAMRTDFDNPHGIRRLRDIMRKMGIMQGLEKKNIEPGQKIYIGSKKEYCIEY